ncbi:MAG: hypothetical protein USCAAHI_01593 [Beijerinckiaceae bacterium]|nr:MAG: hypothetical protein USCAAHI_01593 [Beijerinckiaceae bacterium]
MFSRAATRFSKRPRSASSSAISPGERTCCADFAASSACSFLISAMLEFVKVALLVSALSAAATRLASAVSARSVASKRLPNVVMRSLRGAMAALVLFSNANPSTMTRAAAAPVTPAATSSQLSEERFVRARRGALESRWRGSDVLASVPAVVIAVTASPNLRRISARHLPCDCAIASKRAFTSFTNDSPKQSGCARNPSGRRETAFYLTTKSRRIATRSAKMPKPSASATPMKTRPN